MIYYMPDFGKDFPTLDEAEEYLVQFSYDKGDLCGKTQIWLTEKDEDGDYKNPTRAWVAKPYVSIEGGEYIAPNHPDNGDDPEYSVERWEICPDCLGRRQHYVAGSGYPGTSTTCTTCNGTGGPKKC